MLKKNLKKIILALFMCSALVSVTAPAYVASEAIISADEIEVEPRTDIKGWVYKVIDGDLYKRLYNYTRNRYEGDWIFVAAGVEE